jgi:hypothetical protein
MIWILFASFLPGEDKGERDSFHFHPLPSLSPQKRGSLSSPVQLMNFAASGIT